MLDIALPHQRVRLSDMRQVLPRQGSQVACLHTQCPVYPPCVPQPAHPQVLLPTRQLRDHRLFPRGHHVCVEAHLHQATHLGAGQAGQAVQSLRWYHLLAGYRRAQQHQGQ
ncbi:hypothetical protein CRUP_016326 [Coryphaenoides rupestris]|nr:hypothetical protein CRUP_016326 [Coryphaenoides rupestris]